MKKQIEEIHILDDSKFKFSGMEKKFACLLADRGIDEGWVREYRFCPPRRWRADFAHLPTRTLVELDGLVSGRRGGHQTHKGIISANDKMNAAVIGGWRVLRFNQVHLKDPDNVVAVVQAAQCVGDYYGDNS